jgi:CheY-like chemotaxis protein
MGDKLPDNPLRVLVVDDRRDAVFLLKTLLTKAGYEVLTAENGEAGLEAVRSFAPQVVISDLALPGAIDGYALAQAVRCDPTAPSPYFVAITGYDDDEHRRLAQEAGFHHYLVKPAALDQLLSFLSGVQANSSDPCEPSL